MSSSLSGGTNALNFNVVKSSSSTITSLTSSSSLTISEPSNSISQSAIRTKRTRTNRKRPNQKYNEAAELLSEAYPNLFRNLKKLHPPPCKFTKPTKPLITECYNNDFFEPLLLPFDFRKCDYDDAKSFLIQNKSASQTEVFSFQEKEVSEEIVVNSGEVLERDSGEGFDCKSMLDDETEEGIDSIIGSRVQDSAGNSGGDGEGGLCYGGESVSPWFEGFGRKFGMTSALRGFGGVNLLNFAMVDVLEISKVPVAVSHVPVTGKKKQKKKENVERRNLSLDLPLRLKLDYEDVRSLWSARGSPFRR